MSQQKVWFITGSSRGFGRIWTEAVLKRGDKVAASARNPKALKAFVEAYGDAVLPLKLDVTDRDAVFQAVRKAHQHFGRRTRKGRHRWSRIPPEVRAHSATDSDS